MGGLTMDIDNKIRKFILKEGFARLQRYTKFQEKHGYDCTPLLNNKKTFDHFFTIANDMVAAHDDNIATTDQLFEKYLAF